MNCGGTMKGTFGELHRNLFHLGTNSCKTRNCKSRKRRKKELQWKLKQLENDVEQY